MKYSESCIYWFLKLVGNPTSIFVIFYIQNIYFSLSDKKSQFSSPMKFKSHRLNGCTDYKRTELPCGQHFIKL